MISIRTFRTALALLVLASWGTAARAEDQAVRRARPLAFEANRGQAGARRPVVGDYVVDGEGRVLIRLGAYDGSLPLGIDPVLAYSTYLGGFGPEGDPAGAAGIAVDAAGNAYVTGTTESLDFPTTAGANQTRAGSITLCGAIPASALWLARVASANSS